MKKEIPWDLIVSKLKQELTAEEDRQLAEWLSNEGNREVFDELHQMWQKVQARAASYTPDKNKYWAELSKRMDARKAASLPKEKILSFTHLRRYAAVACVLLVAAFSACLYIGVQLGRPALGEQVYSNLGGKSRAQLPDGTEVWLHANTTLAYSTDYKSEERLVNVKGEAYFDVTHDKEKPFIVQTDGMRVVVHGTKFNVEAFPESENTFVSLIEGSVSLETDMEKRFLVPGETATFNKHSRQLHIEKGDVDFMRSWANEHVVFNKKSLGYVCQYLSKWYNVKINVAPELADKYLYTFTLRNETLEEIMRIMSRINPMEYSFDEKNVLTVSPKK